MQIVVLIEPAGSGRFRAKAGEPINLCAEGPTAEEATAKLGGLIDAMIKQGRQFTTISIANGQVLAPADDSLPADSSYQTDWAFRELQEAMPRTVAKKRPPIHERFPA